VAFASGWYRPGSHSSHAVPSEPGETAPGGHDSWDAASGSGTMNPGAAASQLVCPSLGWKDPGEHAVHSEVPPFDILPAGHGVESVDPLNAAKVPGSAVVQKSDSNSLE